MARLVFLGTPKAAIPTLRAVAARHDVVLVVTQPDRPKGRSRRPQPQPVKVTADDLGLRVAQPTDSSGLLSSLEGVGEIDLGVVVAYGRILQPEVLDLPGSGFLNVHFSLLPRWRGAAPVARALIDGDTMTGVTIMKLDEGLDTGPVLTAQAVDILPSENAGELTARLAALGARLLADAIDPYLKGALKPVAQSDEGATYADKVTKGDRALSVELTPAEFVDRVRGLAPDPGSTLQIDGDVFKVLAATASGTDLPEGTWRKEGNDLVVGLAEGSVILDEIQPPGKNPMSGGAWMRGRPNDSGGVG